MPPPPPPDEEEPGFEGFGTFRQFIDRFEYQPLLQIVRYRKGGDSQDWGLPGNTRYSPKNGFFLMGSSKWTGAAATSGSISVTLPADYYGTPLCLATPVYTDPLFQDIRCYAVADPDHIEIYWWSAVNITEAHFHWLTLGPAGI